MRGTGYFWIRRLHSLSGLWLAVVYVVCFLLPWSSAVYGAASFNAVSALLAAIPFRDALHVVVIGVPLLFHAVMGLMALYGSQLTVVSYGVYRNWMYALQRATGIVLLPFVLYHIVRTQLAFAFTGRFADFVFVQRMLSPGWVRALYCAGVICAALHIGGGAAAALTRWGITVSRRSQDVAAMLFWVVALALGAWGVRIVFAF